MPQSFAKLKAGETCGQGINADHRANLSMRRLIMSIGRFVKNAFEYVTM